MIKLNNMPHICQCFYCVFGNIFINPWSLLIKLYCRGLLDRLVGIARSEPEFRELGGRGVILLGITFYDIYYYKCIYFIIIYINKLLINKSEILHIH